MKFPSMFSPSRNKQDIVREENQKVVEIEQPIEVEQSPQLQHPSFMTKKLKRCYLYFFPSNIVAKILRHDGKYFQELLNDMLLFKCIALNSDKKFVFDVSLPKKIFYDNRGFWKLRSYNMIPILFYDIRGEMVEEANPVISEIIIRDNRIKTLKRLCMSAMKELELTKGDDSEKLGAFANIMKEMKEALTFSPNDSYFVQDHRTANEGGENARSQ